MIKENIHNILQNIDEICRRTGRHSSEIRVIAVSKNTGIKDIQEAVDSGLINLGESKAQELAQKAV